MVHHVELSRHCLLITLVYKGKHPDSPRCRSWDRDSSFSRPGRRDAILNSTRVSTQWRSNSPATYWCESLSSANLLAPQLTSLHRTYIPAPSPSPISAHAHSSGIHADIHSAASIKRHAGKWYVLQIAIVSLLLHIGQQHVY